MGPTIDSSAPKDVGHLKLRSKRAYLYEQRAAEIAHENRILLDKMTEISASNGVAALKPMRGRSQLQTLKPGVQIDTCQRPVMDTRVVFEPGTVQWSLHKEAQKQSLSRIAEENLAMLGRIQSAKSVYRVATWEGEHRDRERLLSLMSRSRPASANPGARAAAAGINPALAAAFAAAGGPDGFAPPRRPPRTYGESNASAPSAEILAARGLTPSEVRPPRVRPASAPPARPVQPPAWGAGPWAWGGEGRRDYPGLETLGALPLPPSTYAVPSRGRPGSATAARGRPMSATRPLASPLEKYVRHRPSAGRSEGGDYSLPIASLRGSVEAP